MKHSKLRVIALLLVVVFILPATVSCAKSISFVKSALYGLERIYAGGSTAGNEENADKNFVAYEELATGTVNVAAFAGEQLALGTDLTDYIYVLIPNTDITGDVEMKVTQNSVATLLSQPAPMETYPNGSAIAAGNTLLRFAYCGIAPQCITDNIACEVYVGGNLYASRARYCLLYYLRTLLQSAEEEESTLIADLIAYCAAAQSYTGYVGTSVYTIKSSDMTAKSDYVAPGAATASFTGSRNANGYNLTGCGLRFDYASKIYVKFTAPKLNNVKITYTFGTDGVTHNATVVEESKGNYIAYTDAVSAFLLDTVYTFTLSDANAGDSTVIATQTASYSIAAFVTSFGGQQNATGELARALYNYGVSANDYIAPFTPVLRFAVASDIHTRIAGSDGCTQDEIDAAYRRTQGLFAKTYAYAESSLTYTAVDAVLVAGDYTDYGREGQIEAFLSAVNSVKQKDTELLVCLGNHEFWSTGENGSNATTTTKTYARYRKYFNEEPDSHTVINGFHFIRIAPDCNGGRNYSQTKADWLANELAIAAADDPTGLKPIFVYQHISPSGTVYGSSSASDPNVAYAAITVGNVLKNYDQVVLMAGHSHRPVVDPASLAQADYTVLNTGTFAYCGIQIYTGTGNSTTGALPYNTVGGYYSGLSDNYNEHGEKETSAYTIIEVDAKNRVRVQYYDIDADCFMQDPIIIDSIGQKENFTFTSARKTNSVAPVFAESAAMETLYLNAYNACITFPQAECKDGIRNYKVELYEGSTLKRTIYRLSETTIRPIPERLQAPFENLTPGTTYTVKVYGYNTWGKITTSPLTYSFTTPAANSTAELTPDLLSIQFNADGSATNTVTGETLVRSGTVSTKTESSLNNRTVGVLTGEGDWKWYGIRDTYEITKQSLTLEAYVKVDAIPSGDYVDLVSDQQAGGIGFELKTNGNVYFYSYIIQKGTYLSPGGTMPTGSYVHLVGTVQNGTVTLYINGALAGTAECAGDLWWPMKYGAQYLSIGGDAGNCDTSTNFMTGNIAKVSMYSYALTEDQVETVYAARNN